MNSAFQLGDFLSLGRNSPAQLSAWLGAQDEGLLARLQAEAGGRGENIAQFTRIAVADFLAEADEEAWASLLSAMRNADDPGAACVARVAEFRLRLEDGS
jgi:hypothetical protein